MACYCQHCHFVFASGTSNCFSCGRSTTKDDLPFQHYIDSGYKAIGNIEIEERSSTQVNESFEYHEEVAGEQTASSAGSKAQLNSTATSVLQGEDVEDCSRQSGDTDNLSYENGADINSIDQEMVNLQRLQAKQEQQRRELNQRIRRHEILTRLLTLPWRYILRGLLILIFIVLLIVIWNMRYTIFNGIGSIIIALLPLFILIYLLISLFRGHF